MVLATVNMKKPKKRHKNPRPRVCVCGKTLPTVASQAADEPIICPHCGSLIVASGEESALAETQMINVREMARIAQEGLDKEESKDLQSIKPGGAKKKPDSGT
jgi:hypothetical protein